MEDESLVVCNKCNGTGTLGQHHSPFPQLCHKCWGIGKLDWVENIVGKDMRGFHRNSLDDLNVRRLINYVKHEIEKICESFIFERMDETTQYMLTSAINEFMKNIQYKGLIYDYAITFDPTNKYIFYTDIKLNRTIEIVRITTQVR